jgi:hypothetical protein
MSQMSSWQHELRKLWSEHRRHQGVEQFCLLAEIKAHGRGLVGGLQPAAAFSPPDDGAGQLCAEMA